MTALLIAATGAVIAIGLGLLVGAIRKPTPRLVAEVQPPASISELAALNGHRSKRPLSHRIGRRAFDAGLWNFGFYADLKGDLRVAGMTLEQVVARQLFSVIGVVFVAGAVAISLPIPAFVVLGLLVLGVLAAAVGPLQSVRARAEERRNEAAVAVAQYVALVANSVMGGSAINASFFTAAELGVGWIWDELRLALRQAREATLAPSDALSRLAEELQLRELSQLTRALSLSSEQGAPIAVTLREQAALMRRHFERRVVEADDRVTEKMTFPMMMLLIALLAYLGIGAVTAILRSAQTL